MPLNMCGTCGGGLTEYTAPEARCICKKNSAAQKQKDFKHEMLRHEARWLTACGWVSVDIVNSDHDGFTWKTKTGNGPMSQQDAVNTQKEWDKNPEAQAYFELEAEAMSINASIEKSKKDGHTQNAEIQRVQLVKVIEKMVKITNAKVVEMRPSAG